MTSCGSSQPRKHTDSPSRKNDITASAKHGLFREGYRDAASWQPFALCTNNEGSKLELARSGFAVSARMVAKSPICGQTPLDRSEAGVGSKGKGAAIPRGAPGNSELCLCLLVDQRSLRWCRRRRRSPQRVARLEPQCVAPVVGALVCGEAINQCR